MPVVQGEAGVTESALDAQLSGALETAVREIEAGVAAHGATPGTVKVDHLILRGHAARALVDEAREFGADLVVVGLARSRRLRIDDPRGRPRPRWSITHRARSWWPGPPPCARSSWPTTARVALATPRRSWSSGRSWPRSRPPSSPWPRSRSRGSATRPGCTGRSCRRTRSRSTTPAGCTPTSPGGPRSSSAGSGDRSRPRSARAIRRPSSSPSLSGLGADLVVVGTRGHTGLTRMILGSVARKVLLHAPCSVLVVHEGIRGRGLGREDRASEPARTRPGGCRAGSLTRRSSSAGSMAG